MKKALVFALALFLVPGLITAEEKPKSEKTEKAPRNDVHPKPGEYFVDVLAPHLWEGAKSSFSGETVPYWTFSLMAAAAATTQDDKVRAWWLHDGYKLGDWRDAGNEWGEAYMQAGVALALWGTGWAADNQKLATAGEVMMEAEALNGIYTTAFKAMVGRERPDGNGNESFPSGHTSDSFCFAAVIDDQFGHYWAIPAYSLALLTAAARMDGNRHYLSDVVMGAGLGMIVGYSVSRNHDDWPYEKRRRVTEKKSEVSRVYIVPISPAEGSEGAGIGVYIPLN